MQTLKMDAGQVKLRTSGSGFHDISARIDAWLSEIVAGEGLLHVFCQHTSASLTIQENADLDVQADLIDALARLAPASGAYRHSSEGSDDMPAHIKAMLSGVDLTIPVRDGRMARGIWQGVYLIEHRALPHERSVLLTFQGYETAGR